MVVIAWVAQLTEKCKAGTVLYLLALLFQFKFGINPGNIKGGIAMKVILFSCLSLLLLFSTAHADQEIEGAITAIDAEAGTIEIYGVKIIVMDAVIKNLADKPIKLSDLKVGDTVEVDGAFSGTDEMLATEIEKKIFEHGKIEGTLASVDITAHTLTVSGITVKVPESVKLEDLTVGSPIECKGSWTGQKEFTAFMVEVD